MEKKAQKKDRKKLVLDKTTIRTLDDASLKTVQAGEHGVTWSKYPGVGSCIYCWA